MNGCILSTVATDALVLKHQAISIHSADEIFIVLDPFILTNTIIVNNIKEQTYKPTNKPTSQNDNFGM